MDNDTTNAALIGTATQAVEAARATTAAAGADAAAMATEIAELRAQLAGLTGATVTPPATTPKSTRVSTPVSTPPATPAVNPLARELQRLHEREYTQARILALRGFGLTANLSDAQLLAIAPEADPRDPDGRAAYAAWRDANPNLFRAAGIEEEEALRAELAPLEARGGGLFRADDLIARRDKMAVRVPTRAAAAAVDVEATRADLSTRYMGPLADGEGLARSLFGAPPALDGALSPEQLLAILPDVVPEGEGLAAWERWRSANRGSFRLRGVRMTDHVNTGPPASGNPLFNPADLHKSIWR